MRTDRRPPDELRVCPDCSHSRSSANRSKKVLAVWFHRDGRENSFCHHCGARRTSGNKAERPRQMLRKKLKDNSSSARMLWRKSVAPQGTVVENYLSHARGLKVPIPPTIRYLPAIWQNPHAMIALCGLASESTPGILQAPTRVEAVHRTFLSPDGSGKHVFQKRMLGPVSGKPIVLAPPNDGLGLVITEGIEDALSVHAATGLGAWAAGSASHLPRLAPLVPDYIDHVLVIADADEAGQKYAFALAETLLTLKFDVTVKTLDGGYADG